MHRRKGGLTSYSPRELLTWMMKDSDLKKRLMVTVGIVLLVKLMSFIPVPGIDIEAVKSFARMTGADSTIPGAYSFADSVLRRLSILSMGLMPFFSACLLIQLASVIIRPIRRSLFSGEAGRTKIVRGTCILALVLAFVQSVPLSALIQNRNYWNGLAFVPNPGIGFQITCILTMTVAVFVVIPLAELINKRGLGNGYAVIAVSAMAFDFLVDAYRVVISLPMNRIQISSLLLIVILFLGFMWGAYYIRKKDVPFAIKGNESARVNFRMSMVGREPLSYAGLLVIIPIISQITKIYPAYLVSSIGLIFAFTFLYSWIVFDAKRSCDLMGQYGLIENNNDMEAALRQNKQKALLKTAIFLSAVFILPDLLEEFIGLKEWGGKESFAFQIIPHVSVVIFTSVVFDIYEHVKFFKNKQASGITDWGVCYTAFTEDEADIKAAFLNGKSIPTLIEPFRYSWGMPIRTAVDQYRIYTPGTQVEGARKLLVI